MTTTFRTYKVATSRNKESVVTYYFVTDAHNDDELNSRPKVAEWPVSLVHDKDTQERRAFDYCDYMNKLAEASRKAYENNQLVDILKAS